MWLIIMTFFSFLSVSPKNFFFLFLNFFFVYFFFPFYWFGSFLVFDAPYYIFLFLMSVLILFVVVFNESYYLLKFFSFLLVIFSIFFFFSGNFYILFIFFELSVFPIIAMILGFGNQIEKISSSFYLFFYSSICSVPLILIIFNFDYFFFFVFVDSFFCWEVFFFLNIFFLIKFPVYFLHYWLPKAHVEAPTSASMVLAGLLLKLGTSGYFRVTYLLKFSFDFFILIISFFGMILSCFYCLVQSDSKSLAAYSSINHMSFVLLVIITNSNLGYGSSFMVMVSHGFISTLFFFIIGEFYHVTMTRNVFFFGSAFFSDFMFLFLLIFVVLFNCGIPFSISFFGEFFGIGVCLFICFFLFFFLFVYFFISFYYSMFFLVISCMTKSFVSYMTFNFISCLCLLFFNVNFFLLTLFI